jgi:predicted acylesterase/phospholipase RssA
VRIDGRDLVDGGVVSNVPITHALRMGARSVVVLDCGVFGLRQETPRTLAETVAHVVAIMMRQQVAREVPEGGPPGAGALSARAVPAHDFAARVPGLGGAHAGGLREEQGLPRPGRAVGGACTATRR